MNTAPSFSQGIAEKRPPFTVEYFNTSLSGLSEQEIHHRNQQFKALTGFESYATMARDFQSVAQYWRLLHRGPHTLPATLLAPYLNRAMAGIAPQVGIHTKLTPLDEFTIPFRKLASLETNAQLAADYDLSPGHFDALLLNVGTLLAVFWAPQYYSWTDYVRDRDIHAAQHTSHLHNHFRTGLDLTLFDYLHHAIVRLHRTHVPPPVVSDEILYQQAQAIAQFDLVNRAPAAERGSAPAGASV